MEWIRWKRDLITPHCKHMVSFFWQAFWVRIVRSMQILFIRFLPQHLLPSEKVVNSTLSPRLAEGRGRVSGLLACR